MGQAEGIITDNFSSLGKLGFKSPRDIQSMEGGVEGADKKAFAAGEGKAGLVGLAGHQTGLSFAGVADRQLCLSAFFPHADSQLHRTMFDLVLSPPRHFGSIWWRSVYPLSFCS